MKPFGAWHPNIMALLQATPEVLKLAVYPPLCGIFGARLPPHLWISKYVPICTQYVQYVCDILPTHWTQCLPQYSVCELIFVLSTCLGGVFTRILQHAKGGELYWSVQLQRQCTWNSHSLVHLLPAASISCFLLLTMVRVLTPGRRGQPARVMQGQEWRANRVLRLSRELGTIVANSNDPLRYWNMCFEVIRNCIIEAYNRTMSRPNREEQQT